MAERSDSSPFALPVGTLIVLLGTVSAYYFTQAPLQTSRPAIAGSADADVRASHSVPARLWQDPFKAVHDYTSDPTPVGTAVSKGRASTQPKSDLDDVADDIQRRVKDGKILVLPVMISNGPYAEAAEGRLRTRYALLAALNVAGYEPEDVEHVGYFKIPWGPQAQSTEVTCKSLVIPYEWMVADPAKGLSGQKTARDQFLSRPTDPKLATPAAPPEWSSVLVLWLDDDAFHHPLSQLGEILWRLSRHCDGRYDAKWNAAGDSSWDHVAVKVIGPDSSTGLFAILSDPALRYYNPNEKTLLDQPIESWHARWKSLAGVEIYSCRATLANKFLEQSAGASPSAQGQTARFWCGSDRPSNFMAWTCSSPPGSKESDKLKLYRTGGTDDDLATDLCAELTLRGVDVEKDPIALVGEWDTIYGRNFPVTFAAAATQPACAIESHLYVARQIERLENPAEWPKNLRQFVYLRGVDGVVAQTPGEKDKSDKARDKESPDKDPSPSMFGNIVSTANEPLPDGPAQLDYIRRIAAELDRMDSELWRTSGQHVRAIGVLGTDIYDKLLLLRALHDGFPGIVFFTADLDNRLLAAKDLAWTRNLIVASHYGLQLRTDLQGDIPPFRDTYQTALYASCLTALNWLPHSGWRNSTPRLFEIGRSGAFDISLRNNEPLHPPTRIEWDRGKFGLLVLEIVVLLVVVYHLLKSASPFFRQLVTSPQTAKPGDDPSDVDWHNMASDHNLGVEMRRLRRILAVFAVIALVMSGWITYGHFNWPKFEPFVLLEGISAWPSEFLRLIAIALCICFMVQARHALYECGVGIASEFQLQPPECVGKPSSLREFLTEAYSGIRGYSLGRWEAREQPDNVPALWTDYLDWASIRRRIGRVAWKTIAYCLAACLIMNMLGVPKYLYRGYIEGILERVTFWAALLFLVALTFFVVDATRLCSVFSRKLAGEHTKWKMSFRDAYALARNMRGEDVGDLLDIDLISCLTEVVGRLIFYPFIVLFVLLVSRMNFLNRWDWPPSLLITYSVIFIYAVGCVLVLRATAEKARSNALNNLNNKLLKLQGDGDAAKSRVEQLLLVIKQIEGNDRGAFAPIQKHPLVQALLIPAGGISAITLLNVLLGPR